MENEEKGTRTSFSPAVEPDLYLSQSSQAARQCEFFSLRSTWESEVWVAEDPDHLIHFDGERFLGPYPDVLPKQS